MNSHRLSHLVGTLLCCVLFLGCSKSDHTPPTGVAGVTPEGRMEMQFKWDVGKRYVMHMDLTSDSELTLPNQPQPTKQVTTMAQDYTVSVLSELPEGGRELQLEFTGMKMESRMGDRLLMSFDSAQDRALDAGNPVAPVLRRTVGGRLKYIVDAEGRVERVEGGREFIARTMQGSPAQLQANLGGMYNEGYFKQLCDVGRIAPGRGVKPGSTWPLSFEEEMGSLGTLYVKSRLKFADWEQHGDRRCARIESTGEVTTKPPEAAGGAAPVMMFEIEKGQVTGTGWFDPALGMVVESVADQDLTIKITTQGQTIPSQAKQKINFKLVDVVDVAPL